MPYVKYLTVCASDLQHVKSVMLSVLDDCFADVYRSSILDVCSIAKQHSSDTADVLMF